MQFRNPIAFSLTVALLLALAPEPAPAQEMQFFRIGTGGAGGTYYPIGGLVAQAISNPPGARPCEEGGSCGVPGLIAVAQSSNGSVANVKAVESGGLESGFAQSDVAYWAHTGTGVFEGSPPMANLRAITNLYPETIHLVAGPGSGIRTVKDLQGKRVSLDEPGSGTLVDARIILQAHGLSEADLKPEYVKPEIAADRMRAGQLDAFFIVAGYPTASVRLLAEANGAVLVPIDGPEADGIVGRFGFFARDVIPATTYAGLPETRTLSVGAQWVVNARLDEERVYRITQALWSAPARKLLDDGHPKARSIVIEKALAGVGIPLHPGAARFYREAGLLK